MDLQLKDRVYLVTGGATSDGPRPMRRGRRRPGGAVRPQRRVLDAAVADLGDAAVAVVADNADPARRPG